MGNLPQAEPSIDQEFGTLHEILGLIEMGLQASWSGDESHWFPNNIAAHACLVRAYQGLQASACLCALGFYTESMATMRIVYESAGLARSLAHKPKDAEDWLHKGHWKSDGFSRKFSKEMTSSSSDSGIKYNEFYDQSSGYAHPMAISVLPMLFGHKGNDFRPRLYPEFDEDEFRKVARSITLEALFVAFAFRNASATFETIPAWWLKRLDEISAEATGRPVADAQRDWAEHDRRYEQLMSFVRHDDELPEALASDPNSLKNVKQRAREAEPETGQG
jgi:hypothetical protein